MALDTPRGDHHQGRFSHSLQREKQFWAKWEGGKAAALLWCACLPLCSQAQAQCSRRQDAGLACIPLGEEELLPEKGALSSAPSPGPNLSLPVDITGAFFQRHKRQRPRHTFAYDQREPFARRCPLITSAQPPREHGAEQTAPPPPWASEREPAPRTFSFGPLPQRPGTQHHF